MAITYQGNTTSGENIPATLPPFSEAINSGDLIVGLLNGVRGIGATYTVSDNTNSGNYLNALNFNYAAGGIQLLCFYKVCNASGGTNTTAPSITGVGTGFTYCYFVHYSGFVNTPTLIAGDVTSNSGDTSTATATGFNNSQPNELLLAFVNTLTNTSTSTTSGGWTIRAAGSNGSIWEQQQSTAGNAISFSNTLSGTDFWQTGIVGFYDAQLVVPGYSSAAGLGPG